jgi:hypothetical protein
MNSGAVAKKNLYSLESLAVMKFSAEKPKLDARCTPVALTH